MSRYLTPSRIGLFNLALLYNEGQVPSSETVPLLSFLVTHIVSDGFTSDSTSRRRAGGDVNIGDFEAALLAIPSVVTGRNLWDLFLKKLWSIDCLHSLNQLLLDSLSIITKSRQQLQKERDEGLASGPSVRISRTSPLGAFVRRINLEYTRLHFSDAATIWQQFVKWRTSTRLAFEKKNSSDGRNIIDLNLSELDIGISHPITESLYGSTEDADEGEERSVSKWISAYDADRLMEFQVSELQRFGGRLPAPMRDKLRHMSISGASIPVLGHYLTFLDSWRAGDHASAFDNLHRYFDYTVQSRDRTFYQYALLNLAILQADFGCHHEAIAAMQEAISTAREKKDVTCLNFCMSWLYHFGKSFPAEMKEMGGTGIAGNEIEALRFLKTKAKDAEMWSLMSSSLLSEARLGLQNGECIAHAFEIIAKSAHLNVNKAVSSMQGPTLLMRSSVYGRVGLFSLACSGCDTFIECYADEAAAEDILKCTCRMAHLLVQRGRYKQAHEQLNNIPESIMNVLKYHQYWIFFSGMLKLRQCLHRDDMTAASYLASQLRTQGAPDAELSFSLSLLEIDLHVRQSQYIEALDLVEALAKSCQQENTDIVGYIKLRNTKARILALCGHPLQGFTITVRAASTAYRTRALPCLWEACINLTHILLHLHDPTAALQILEAIIPHVLECQDGDLAARTYSSLVDAHMALAAEAIERDTETDTEPDLTKRNDRLSQAAEYLDSALKEYARVEDLQGQLEMLAKKGTIMQLCGDSELADDIATKYVELKREYRLSQSDGDEE